MKIQDHLNPDTIPRLYEKVALQSILYGCKLWCDLRQRDLQELSNISYAKTLWSFQKQQDPTFVNLSSDWNFTGNLSYVQQPLYQRPRAHLYCLPRDGCIPRSLVGYSHWKLWYLFYLFILLLNSVVPLFARVETNLQRFTHHAYPQLPLPEGHRRMVQYIPVFKIPRKITLL